ncbi:drug/metabolite transporter (DMT)-like permease [Bacillus oleivorans]|uniref:Drug/metabolite transporter (DMT)-like permease n=1 Tax=Bacillus oleivorans TaxID=1448271 RepID=A0A285CIC9_9BACI|nr:DMT family transporter [Bacillus oleivorans]SNX66766.1 drug/metabolite transporter (DMT)-like permease [Bacillus oleivorans]
MNKGIGLLVIATILWAGNYICGRYLGLALPPTLLNTMRWAISTVILIGILSLNKKKLPVFSLWKEFIILGFTGIFAFSTLTYLALTNISASQAGMISAGIPIAILFFTPFILKERIGVKAWAGAVISIIGVFLLFQGRLEDGSSSNTFIGNIQVVLACLAWGLYTVLGKRYGNKADPLTLTAGAALFGTIFSAISSIGMVDVRSIHMTGTAWICLIYVSTFASVGAFLAWNVGVKMVGASKSAPYLNLLPVWTVVLGLLLLDEEMSWISGVGGTIAIMGAVLASVNGKVTPKNKLGADSSV